MSKQRAHLIANAKSGLGKGATLAAEASSICAELGYELVKYPIASAADFESQSQIAVENAMQDGGVVIAAGGDGTIRGVAQAAHGKPVRFAIVPCGTFNFFARNHKIPEDVLEAFRLALTGEVRPVRLGQVNGQVFLINASLGLYAKSIREREHWTARFGRNRLVVILSSIFTLLTDHLLLRVDLRIGKQITTLRTPMIFIGNNALQLRDMAMQVAHCMKADLLAVVLMKPVRKLETLRIIWRGIFKTLENEERLETFCVDELTIHTRQRLHEVALDGELFRMISPLRVQALPAILNMVLPPKGPPA
jgi:diacylglycerol kinase family enzyme